MCKIFRTVIATFICPSDPAASNPIASRFATHNATPAMMLWYPASMGPTHMDNCDFYASKTPSSANSCCQGYNFGTNGNAALGISAGTFAGMFGRTSRAVGFHEITDGLSTTFMGGLLSEFPTDRNDHSAQYIREGRRRQLVADLRLQKQTLRRG